jgi:hypothetical protein
MGVATSRIGSYSNTFMMGTNGWVEFIKKQQRNLEVAKAAGSMQATQQIMLAGGGPGGGGGGASVNTGWSGATWFHVASVIQSLAPVGVVAGGLAALVVYLTRASQRAMFFALAVALFLLVHFVLFITRSQTPNIQTGQNFFVALTVGLGGAGLLAFMVYDPDKGAGAEPAQVQLQPVQPQVPAGGGRYAY